MRLGDCGSRVVTVAVGVLKPRLVDNHVIPAKAGIQEVNHRRYWIPAFAGMTEDQRLLAFILSA